VGWVGQIVVQHNESNDKTSANVTSVLRKKNLHGPDITDDDMVFPGDN
jgi:hypothetical protein